MALTEAEAAVIKVLNTKGPEIERTLGELVAINSYTQNTDGVNEVGRWIERHLMESGLKVGAFVTGVSGQHMIGRTTTFDGNRLMLLGHLDTVFPPEDEAKVMAVDPQDETRLLGPGVTDMKGGLSLVLTVLRVLAESGKLEGRSLSFVLSADEETGSPSGHDIVAQEAADHHLCLVFETGSERPDGLTTFVTERKGCGRAKIEIRGVESHSGAKKEEGLSAALEMAHKVIALEALNDFERGMTVTAGIARSGTAANTVPGHAVIEVDYRFKSSADGDEIEAAMERICRPETSNDTFGLVPEVTLVSGTRHEPMTRTEAVERMAVRIKSYAEDLGLELEEEFRGGASDGNIASAAGCPTVDGLGSVGGKIHSPEEWVSRQSLVDRACLLAVTILRFYEL